MKKVRERPFGVSQLAGGAEGGTYLAQHLALSHYHGVQAAGNPEQVVGAPNPPVLVQVSVKYGSRNSRIGSEKFDQPAYQIVIMVVKGIDLQAIASGKDYALLDVLS
jgi:hypothetical protein